MDEAPDLQLLRRSQALVDGYTDGELARAVRRGELRRLQRGTYVPSSASPPGDAGAAHRLAVAATVADLRSPAVVSHTSAAAVHGLPLWGVRLDRVHILRTPPASGSGSRRLRLHVARCADDETTVVDGLLVTTATRTVVDVARSVSFESAVVTADFALRARATTPEALRDSLARMGAAPGVCQAARVVDFADARSESVGESRSRVTLHRLGLPSPDLQPRVLRRDGTVIGRSDFGWEAFRTLGEFDGRVKYGRLLKPGQAAGDAVFLEKRREDEMRDHRWEVARWTWDELDRPRIIADRIRRAFARGRR
jgi:predicted transcriptional regulator of viral defense system